MAQILSFHLEALLGDHQIGFQSALTACLILFLAVFVTLRLRNAFLSDLAKVPGPWHAKLTSFYVRYKTVLGQRCHWVHALHDRYGSVVRIAPNEIAICHPDATNKIHAVSSQFFKSVLPGIPVSNLFSMTDPSEHAQRRRLYGKWFTQMAMRRNWEERVSGVVHEAIGKIRRDLDREGKADVYRWFMLMANDVVSMLTVGEGNLVRDEGNLDAVLTAVGLHKMLAWASLSVPVFLLCRALSPLSKRLDSVFRHDRTLFAFGQRGAAYTRQAQEGSAPANFISMALDSAAQDKKLVEAGHAQLRDEEIGMDAAGFQLAGAETVGITLTYLIWRVLGHQTLQTRLEEEVASLEEVTDSTCEKLPFLNAVIDETLRLHGAAPTALRRIVPPGGANLAGYYIPAGKLVATQAWSIHRDERLWPEPLSFYPERWLVSPAPGRTTESFMPFGGGSRICAGVHLARMELRLATALFFRQCRGARLGPSVTERSMRVIDRFNTGPMGGRCEVVMG